MNLTESKVDRLLKIFTVLMPTSFTFFVIIDNIFFAWDDNFQFVKHVMSMDTVESVVHWRTFDNPIIWKTAYTMLICFETATFLIGVIALYKLIKALNKDQATFFKAKLWGYLTFVFTLLIWFFGFIDIGGEWFKMWLSPSWNGQPIAMWLSILFAVLLGIFHTSERES
ncbi:DUF2165 domain-containing protein [Vagococcus coleopterorum]|uniref:DUF2165 domain-containing protein n=1 Tax=Vagococcus coleopterorum TaxID=2714946 RepID=A0A6G8AP55_9ENTE|nr:DUF2165 domain-containing protein [Vagococcus coleopterorum]QIL46703.1 DUF2165 domain-containing protein [Vagococcus coleopterorum]